MNKLEVFPDKPISSGEVISDKFLSLGIDRFIDACRYVREMPYGYNTDRDDLMILFKERKGTCTTKHAVIATLAEELGLPIKKYVGIYAMTQKIVTGTDIILDKYYLPYIPMVHCFLVYRNFRVDLSEGNDNSKNQSLDDFLYIEQVEPNISAKDEYLLYRKALAEHILTRKELAGVSIKQILQAREEGLKLLKRNINHP
jgi:hypothetical protein